MASGEQEKAKEGLPRGLTAVEVHRLGPRSGVEGRGRSGVPNKTTLASPLTQAGQMKLMSAPMPSQLPGVAGGTVRPQRLAPQWSISFHRGTLCWGTHCRWRDPGQSQEETTDHRRLGHLVGQWPLVFRVRGCPSILKTFLRGLGAGGGIRLLI